MDHSDPGRLSCGNTAVYDGGRKLSQKTGKSEGTEFVKERHKYFITLG